jgi:hypothetical protein
MKNNDDIGFLLNAFGALLLVIAGLFFAMYVVIPAAIIYGIYLAYKWYTKPPPATTEELYRQSTITYFPTPEQFTNNFGQQLSSLWPHTEACDPILYVIASCTLELYKNENLAGAPMRVFEQGTREEARYRDELITQANRAYDPLPVIETMHAILTASFTAYINALPPMAYAKTSDAMFRVSLQDAIPNLNATVQNVVFPFCTDNLFVFKGVKPSWSWKIGQGVKVCSAV